MAIKTYQKGSSEQLSTNFKAREFDCQGRGCCSTTPIDEKLVQYLQQIRTHFGKPVYVTAYRCKTHNAKVANAAPNSYHCYGQAADFHIDGVKPEEIAKYAESIGIKGIGLYDTFVHIDTRTSKSFWYSHAQERRTTFGGAPVAEPAAKYSLSFRNLQSGCQGEDVRALQILLNGRGQAFNCGSADGIFGAKTETAVRKYRQANKLPVTGVADAATMGCLLGLK